MTTPENPSRERANHVVEKPTLEELYEEFKTLTPAQLEAPIGPLDSAALHERVERIRAEYAARRAEAKKPLT